MAEHHDPEGEAEALHNLKAAADAAVDALSGDDQDQELRDKIEAFGRELDEAISDWAGNESAESEDEDERQDEEEMYAAEDGDQRGDYVGTGIFSQDLDDPKTMQDESAAGTSNGALQRRGYEDEMDVPLVRPRRMMGTRASLREADAAIRRFERRYGPQAPVAGDLRAAVAHRLREREITTQDLLDELAIGARASHTNF